MPRANRGYYLKLQRSGVWAIAWAEPGSRVVRTQSTGETDRARAQEILARYVAALKAPPDPGDSTIREICAAYSGYLQQKTRHWVRHRSKLRAVVRDLGWISYSEFNQRHIEQYQFTRSADGIARGTIVQELVMLRQALRRHAQTYSLPLKEFPKLQRPPPRKRWLTREEVDKLLAACITPHVRLFIVLAVHTGARTEAMLELTWDRVDLDGGMIDYGQVEGGKGRARVPINATLLAELRHAFEHRTTRFVIERAGDRVHEIGRTVSRMAKRAGIPHMTPHDLRRTAGSWMLQRGVKMEVVSRVLGHRSIRTTEQVYGFLDDANLRDAVETLA